jgi:hypothetical protein
MRDIGPRPVIGLVAIMLLSVVVFLGSVAGAYVVDSYASPGWNENCVPPPILY